MTLALLIIVPAVMGLVTLKLHTDRVALSLLLVTAAAHLIVTALLWSNVPGREFGIFLQLDITGLLFLSITSVLFFITSLYTVPYILDGTHDEQASPQRFVPCLLWFLAAMTLVTVTHHFALMWAAVEATTLASAPLVYFYKRKGALEAAWKYLLICSVGIALALMGVFFLGIAASVARENSGLGLAELISAAPLMSRSWLKAAFVLALVGFGTKMGLAPLHTWLPDTHSQAPSPVSALLSGALLNCALLAILRFYQVCLASGDAQFARSLLVLFGLLSIGVACAFMVRQGDYKRLFAYSSIENMGIIAVGFGLGGGGVYGALLHSVNHSLCKAGLFFVAGNVLREFGTTSARDVRGVLHRLPASGVIMMALFFAIGGTPPFGPFISELIIFRSAISAPDAWVGVLFLVLLAVAFLGMAGVLLPMLQSSSTEQTAQRPAEHSLSVLAPLLLAAGALVLGVYIPPAFADVLRQAASALGG